ncbi:MAG: aromatic amino acid ammonia-lyase [Pseudomonadota bacterium]
MSFDTPVPASTDLPLDGHSLTPVALIAAAANPVRPIVSDAVWTRVRTANTVLLQAAAEGQKIYGLTTGVGANKDQKELEAANLLGPDGGLTPEAATISAEFNKALLNAHGAGVGEAAPAAVVRAAMIVRLNCALTGGSGMEESVARRLAEMLEHDILPMIPYRGSVGQADITLMSHVGLVMKGRWWADHKGTRKTGDRALADAGLEPLTLLGKDALSCFSSNAYSGALAAEALYKLEQFQAMLAPVFAMCLQALNGNLAPLMAEPASLRPFPRVIEVAERIRKRLAGSYLYDPSDSRPLQDPLSYRTAIYQFGGLDQALSDMENVLEIQLNAADDNPVVFVGDVSPTTAKLPGVHLVKKPGLEGAVVPSASFSPLPQVLAQQSVAIACGHVSEGILNRTLALMDPHLTGLPRFLRGPDAVHAFGAIHKPIGAVAAENRELANPVSMDFAALALGIEDMATNAPRVARRLIRIAENMSILLAFELLLAAQAIDLRLQKDPKLALSAGTRVLHAKYRQVVPFLSGDTQVLSTLIDLSHKFILTIRPSHDPETDGI